MGNASSSQPQPNQIDILQSGGCSGGGSCGISAPTFDATSWDQRLTPFLTWQEYSDVIVNANNVLKQRAPTCKALGFTILMCITAAILVILGVTNPPSYKCLATNGMCRSGQDPVADSCCLAICCPNNEERRLQHELKNFEIWEVSEQRRQEGYYLNVTSANSTHRHTHLSTDLPTNASASLHSIENDGYQVKRRLLSSRMGRGLTRTRGCENVGTDADVDNIPAECMCVQGAKRRKCSGSVTVTGPAEKDEGLQWAMFVGMPLWAGGFCLPFGWAMYFGCALPDHINPVLEPWIRKGLQARYQRGSKHYQARISVFTPADATAMVVGHTQP
eukprot:TRINITY_DN16662_c0_g1_i1.p1 TRINITY_DN16662_c0_g1~~TRINITY_DN16662_c0_g1_i1.p1  ORF type:complete len:361 (-),score=21.57 TRINITY_DN16662_c0_g1_i1:135-1130(-)